MLHVDGPCSDVFFVKADVPQSSVLLLTRFLMHNDSLLYAAASLNQFVVDSIFHVSHAAGTNGHSEHHNLVV